ncbi:endonuclease V [Olivibacter sitiensis]|uniref:endonuclease V n=1 Tax=Olivibacter sitiensis TaxID=376470 RepID=UPI0003FB3256|nr:endonuclease V [Olivibacter sitiensis]
MEDTLSYEGLTIGEATAIQRNLREQIVLSPLPQEPSIIAGADISLNRFSETIFAGIVLLDYQTLRPIAYSAVQSQTKFPYVPGFLAFREVPALVACYAQLLQKPDVIVVDGHGYAHPRRMGIATHLGTVLGVSTMGCAKKKLYGKYIDPPEVKGSYSPLESSDGLLGYTYRTKNKVKPVFVSPGNLVDFSDCLRMMAHCALRYRLPEPTRLAHNLVNQVRTGQLPVGYHLL